MAASSSTKGEENRIQTFNKQVLTGKNSKKVVAGQERLRVETKASMHEKNKKSQVHKSQMLEYEFRLKAKL